MLSRIKENILLSLSQDGFYLRGLKELVDRTSTGALWGTGEMMAAWRPVNIDPVVKEILKLDSGNYTLVA